MALICKSFVEYVYSKNYTHRYIGVVSMETAISKSLNAATIDLACRIGIDAIRETAGLIAIQSDIHPVHP